MTRRRNYTSDFAAYFVLLLKLKSFSDLDVSLAGSTSFFLQSLFHFFRMNILNVEGSLMLMARFSSLPLQWWLLLLLICCRSFLKNGFLWFNLMWTAQWRSISQWSLFINFRTLLPYFANGTVLKKLRSGRCLLWHLRCWLFTCLQDCQEIIDEIIWLLRLACYLTLFLWIVVALLL